MRGELEYYQTPFRGVNEPGPPARLAQDLKGFLPGYFLLRSSSIQYLVPETSADAMRPFSVIW